MCVLENLFIYGLGYLSVVHTSYDSGLEERHSLFSEYQRNANIGINANIDILVTYILVSRESCDRFSSSSPLNTT